MGGGLVASAYTVVCFGFLFQFFSNLILELFWGKKQEHIHLPAGVRIVILEEFSLYLGCGNYGKLEYL